MWKYRADADASARAEHLAALRRLPNVIPEIISFSVGTDVLELPRSYHTGLTSTFADRAALDVYTIHPAHQEVVALGRAVSENVVSVDFITPDE